MGIVTGPVHPVSDLPVAGGSSYRNTDILFDYAIGGLPFISGVSDKNPLGRDTAEYTKTQVDQSAEPGEQTLVAWWLRSQSSFHGGTGIVFEEPDGSSSDQIQYRFADSAGVDVWTPGHVSLLKQAPLDRVATAPLAMGATDANGVDCYFLADGNVLKRCLGDGGAATVTWGGTGTILSMCHDGTNYYVADNVGVWKGTLAGGAGSKLWNTGSSRVTIAWVKNRLMAGIANAIYELAGGTPPTLPAATYTHPNTAWTWTGITDSPQAIYASGFAGSTSELSMFVLDTSGDVPTLTGAITAAQLPEGEVVRSIYGYLGSYVAIGTNKGVRVADVQSDGSLQYGPISVEVPTGTAVYGIVGSDRFLYGSYANGINGASGLWRIDLGTTIGLKQFAYASDLQAHQSGAVKSVTMLGSSGRLVFTVDGHGAYVESAADLEPTGYLRTGNIRYHILEPKLYKFVRVWAAPLSKGGLSVSVNDHAGNPTSLVTYTAGGFVPDPLDEIAMPSTLGQQEFVSLTIGLTRDSVDHASGPTVTAYQLKALPAQKRQRVFTVPLLVFDKESDRNGAKRGRVGSAIQRILALEALEEAGDVVRFDDLTPHGQPPRQVLIDGLSFQQLDPAKVGAHVGGWGGILTAKLRTVV